ncbi:unnamed protein product [Closterium sp. NIES-64]|nr:unnamed protein product [Closterium sp. NIES-64]CAI6005199.1 unnamed protein product [Closterium sp. NIES-65]
MRLFQRVVTLSALPPDSLPLTSPSPPPHLPITSPSPPPHLPLTSPSPPPHLPLTSPSPPPHLPLTSPSPPPHLVPPNSLPFTSPRLSSPSRAPPDLRSPAPQGTISVWERGQEHVAHLPAARGVVPQRQRTIPSPGFNGILSSNSSINPPFYN